MEEINLKVNKIHVARECGVDPRTVGKYLDGYIRLSHRKSKLESPIFTSDSNLKSK